MISLLTSIEILVLETFSLTNLLTVWYDFQMIDNNLLHTKLKKVKISHLKVAPTSCQNK